MLTDDELDKIGADASRVTSHDVLTLLADLQAERTEVTRLRGHLQTIRDQYGKVCETYELCRHAACESSIGAWFEAYAALKPASRAQTEEGDVDYRC